MSKKGGKKNTNTNNTSTATGPKDLTVKKGPVEGVCTPVKVTEGSIYQLLREVLGPAFMSFRGDGLNSGLSMPCWMYEPISILQRSAGMFEYAELLEKAAMCKDSLNRMAFVAAFIVSIYCSTPNRFKINFNPILGETFEFVDTRWQDPVKYFSEQVSHHPPRTATHAYNSKWTFMQNYHPTTAFLGNNVNLDTHYRTYIQFHDNGDKFFIQHPVSKIHNIMMGSTWLEHYGELTVVNTKNEDSCVIEFKKSGFMQGPNYKVEGKVTSGKETIIKLSGTWNGGVSASWSADTKDFPEGTQMSLWEMDEEDYSEKAYRMSDFALSWNYLTPELKKLILPTDSRRRLDIRYLNKGEDKRATAWKQVAENKQREEEKELKQKAGDNENFWEPVWFKADKDHEDQDFWSFRGNFWQNREKRSKALAAGKEVELFYAPAIKDSAADFTCYRRLFSETIDNSLGSREKKEKEKELKKTDSKSDVSDAASSAGSSKKGKKGKK
eukprot:TRINITY_DN11414_c0_g1_i1.p1 TRINITY_DN11414_c0_g1~~TRINITY_DN11414_c0_g1_i1.p1  ORF type:complete len:496 (-),score=132.99 TRINITY_DN11414_c0_g1_i1:53-1540(-)